MSTATIPFQLRRGPLPFCSQEASVSGSNIDYVNLPEIGGDGGLQKATELYWRLERVRFFPVGTMTTYLGVVYSFSHTSFIPEPEGPPYDYEAFGAVLGGLTTSNPSTPSAEPVRRICPPSEYLGRLLFGSLVYIDAHPAGGVFRQVFTTELFLSFSGGRWRLGYRFHFLLNNNGGVMIGRIQNPARNSNPAYIFASGTITFLGVDVNWNAEHTSASPLRPEPSGFGLGADSVMWTF